MAKLYINTKKKKGTIHKEIYGHFAEHLGRCIYGGIYVGEDSSIPNTNGMRNDVVEALKEMGLPVLRWPGGCFADEYHWQDGIGPKENRKKMVNTNWGGVVEDNSFGTHEFMELCRQLGCENYINGNVGSGTVQEMADWVEYMTFDGISPMAKKREENGHKEPWQIDFFGVGNESWGCGGNMRPEYYADEYRRYQTFVRQHQQKKIYKIACGASEDDYAWTDKVMNIAGKYMDGISLHFYTIPTGSWKEKGSATEFTTEEYYKTLRRAARMEELLQKHSAIMDQYDPEKRVGLIVDEWGTWYDVEPGTNPGFLYQQNTMRDAIVAAMHLNLFNHHCDRVRMANMAQLVNVLQAVILTEGDKMIKTPTYYIFDMFQHHQNATLLDSYLADGEEENQDGLALISQSVSEREDGTVVVTLANLSAEKTFPMELAFSYGEGEKQVTTAEILSGEMHEKNTFEKPEEVKKKEFMAYSVEEGLVKFEMPTCSVIHMELR